MLLASTAFPLDGVNLLDQIKKEELTSGNNLNLLFEEALKHKRIDIIYHLISHYELTLPAETDVEILNTLLIKSVRLQRTSLALSLLALGANPNVAIISMDDSPSGCKQKVSTLLHLAIMAPGHSEASQELIALLLDYGAEVNKVCELSGYSPLSFHLSFCKINKWLEREHYPITKLLLEHKANPNFVDKEGKSLLKFMLNQYITFYKPSANPVFLHDKDKTVEVLLKFGARTNELYKFVTRASSMKYTMLATILRNSKLSNVSECYSFFPIQANLFRVNKELQGRRVLQDKNNNIECMIVGAQGSGKRALVRRYLEGKYTHSTTL